MRAIALGGGERPDYLSIFYDRIYACGPQPQEYLPVAYCLGDYSRLNDIPTTTCDLWITSGIDVNVLTDKGIIPKRIMDYTRLGLCHGGSAGGMAINLACLFHDEVYLAGFRGPRSDDSFIPGLLSRVAYWLDQGRVFHNLDGESSIFNNLLQNNNKD